MYTVESKSNIAQPLTSLLFHFSQTIPHETTTTHATWLPPGDVAAALGFQPVAGPLRRRHKSANHSLDLLHWFLAAKMLSSPTSILSRVCDAVAAWHWSGRHRRLLTPTSARWEFRSRRLALQPPPV
jgi:hypothetical protein